MAEQRLPGTVRAWWILERTALRAQSQYRANLFMGFIGGLTYQGIQVAFLALLLQGFGMIGGWGFAELGLVVGIRLAAHACYVMPFGALIDTSRLIHSGDFDQLLIRPTNPFLQVVTRRFNILTIGDGLLGLGALIAFAVAAPVEWNWWRICYLLAAVVGGGLVETAIQVAIASVAFRAGNVFALQALADRTITVFGIYPLTIFGSVGLLALCLLFPLGFIAYLPATALLGRVAEVPLPSWAVWLSPLAGWVLFPLAVALFQRMSRHYTSPGA
ncbi:MAG: ABC-2 family transporter protein [Arachnia propionica]|uniref:ABC transporter permease n=1 Tax=Arachnia propionica TaxID=1750 RepID=UPI0026FC0F3E|nr:ABC-2 family transporter protein [Arachnia propionica]